MSEPWRSARCLFGYQFFTSRWCLLGVRRQDVHQASDQGYPLDIFFRMSPRPYHDIHMGRLLGQVLLEFTQRSSKTLGTYTFNTRCIFVTSITHIYVHEYNLSNPMRLSNSRHMKQRYMWLKKHPNLVMKICQALWIAIERNIVMLTPTFASTMVQPFMYEGAVKCNMTIPD